MSLTPSAMQHVTKGKILPLDPRNLADAANIVGWFPFDGDLEDASGNSDPLTAEVVKGGAGYVAYVADGPGGRKALSLQGGTRLVLDTAGDNAIYQALLAGLTIIAQVRRHDVVTHAQTIVECASAASGSPGDDWPFYWKLGTTNGTFKGGHYGGFKDNDGARLSEFYPNHVSVVDDWCGMAMSRTIGGSDIEMRFWVNAMRCFPDAQWPKLQPIAFAPDNAANAILAIGGAVAGGGFSKIDLANLAFISEPVSEAKLQAEFARCGHYIPE